MRTISTSRNWILGHGRLCATTAIRKQRSGLRRGSVRRLGKRRVRPARVDAADPRRYRAVGSAWSSIISLSSVMRYDLVLELTHDIFPRVSQVRAVWDTG